MGFMPTDHIPDGGGESAPPDSPPTPRDILIRTYTRLGDELDQGNLPAGTIANVLSALAKLAIANAEIDTAQLPPDPDPQATARAQAAVERASARHQQLTDLLQQYFIRLLEVHHDAVQILAQLDSALAGYQLDLARDLRFAITHGHHQWMLAHGYATSGPWDPRDHTVEDPETGDQRPRYPDLPPRHDVAEIPPSDPETPDTPPDLTLHDS